jgi:hypothetical protein
MKKKSDQALLDEYAYKCREFGKALVRDEFDRHEVIARELNEMRMELLDRLYKTDLRNKLK